MIRRCFTKTTALCRKGGSKKAPKARRSATTVKQFNIHYERYCAAHGYKFMDLDKNQATLKKLKLSYGFTTTITINTTSLMWSDLTRQPTPQTTQH